MTTITGLDDQALVAVTKRLASEERQATAALLRALMEVDARRLYLADGCASMFTWCTQVLHLCEGGAYNRIEVARAARRFPVILAHLEDASLTLTAVRLLAPHLTPVNHVAVLASARHRSKREVEVLVAALQPRPDAPAVVRRLPRVGSAVPGCAAAVLSPAAAALDGTRPIDAMAPPRLLDATAAAREDSAPSTTRGTARIATTGPHVPHVSPPPHQAVVPLASDRYRLQVTLTRETHDRLRRAQALLRHAVPTGDTAAILDRALVLLVDHLERRRFAETSHPRVSRPGGSHTRHIPAAVRRAVWTRDAGRCAFTGHQGRCRETSRLEFHHVTPYATGGEATVANIALRCRAHNAHEARLVFGPMVTSADAP